MFDIYFCVFFDCYCQSLISGRETGHWAMPLPKFDIFLIFPWRQLVYQICYTRYYVSFYLWLIGSVLKHCKDLKNYDQECSFKGELSGLRQFVVHESPLKMMKNTKALFILKISKFLSCLFGHVAKRLD